MNEFCVLHEGILSPYHQINTLETRKKTVTRPGCLQECKTELVWEHRKVRFCEGVHKQSCPLRTVSVRRVSTIQDFQLKKTKSFKGFLSE